MQRKLAAVIGGAVLIGALSFGQSGEEETEAARQAILDAQIADDSPGNPAAGRAVFEEYCQRCHVFGAIGTQVGPDLSTLSSRFKKTDVLEAILWPSKTISDQYDSQIIETMDGYIINCIITRETATAVQVVTGELDRPFVIARDNIMSQRASQISIMPEGMADQMTPEDLSNLVAFVLGTPPEQ